jgi:hypothetical protein
LVFTANAYDPDRLDLSPPERLVLDSVGYRDRLSLLQTRLATRVSRGHVLRAIFIGLAAGAIRVAESSVAA